MKRLLQGAPILTTILLLTMSAGNLWADNSGNDTDALQSSRLVAAATPKSPTASKVGAMKRPVLNSDLAVSAIRVTADCKIQVTIRNNGAGGVPDGAYHPNKGVIVQATARFGLGRLSALYGGPPEKTQTPRDLGQLYRFQAGV